MSIYMSSSHVQVPGEQSRLQAPSPKPPSILTTPSAAVENEEYQCYYLQRLRDGLSPVRGIISKKLAHFIGMFNFSNENILKEKEKEKLE